MASKKKSVLFICLGNICRSPIAEAVFTDLVKKRGVQDQWHIDSAAMAGYHIGGTPDDRTMKCLRSHGIEYSHTVRQIKTADFTTFDTIFGMDEENMSDLNDAKPKNSTAKLEMLGSHDPEKQLIIVDPYYGGYDGFERVYKQCVRCCQAFLDANT